MCDSGRDGNVSGPRQRELQEDTALAVKTPMRLFEELGDIALPGLGGGAGAKSSLLTTFSDSPVIRNAWRARRSPIGRLLLGKPARSGIWGMLPRGISREGLVVDQHIREGRFQRSLALIAGMSGLLGGLEVTYEHYQGSYGQRIMYSPVFLSPILFVAGVWGFFSRRVARTLLPISSVALLADGVLGFIFHIRGVARKPGGWRIPVFNVVMGPPLFAPLLLGIGGFLGLIATFLRREDDPERDLPRFLPRPHRPAWMGFIPRRLSSEGFTLEHELREGRFQQVLSGATAVSALLNGMESLYSHYKNNFRYKAQWTPILLSPLIAAAGIGGIFSRRIARTLLPLTSLLAILDGTVGFWYHARGITRMPGGLKKPVYNVIYGPPIFAPLLFAATGFLGVLASLMRREK